MTNRVIPFSRGTAATREEREILNVATRSVSDRVVEETMQRSLAEARQEVPSLSDEEVALAALKAMTAREAVWEVGFRICFDRVEALHKLALKLGIDLEDPRVWG